MSGQPDQPHTAAGGALLLERLVFFSDAVYAIAITLLVLEIEVPHLPESATTREDWIALGELWPSFFAFVLSFLVIGRFWITHHQLFAEVSEFRQGIVWPNLLLLMVIAFMPFATAQLAAGLGRFVPALLYNLTLLATGLAIVLLRHRCARLGIIAPATMRAMWPGTQAVVLAAALSVTLTFVVPQFSQLGMLTNPLWRRLFTRKAPP